MSEKQLLEVLQPQQPKKVVRFTLYKVQFFREHFIVTKNVATNGIIEYNKNLFFIIIICCKELAKSVYFIWTKN